MDSPQQQQPQEAQAGIVGVKIFVGDLKSGSFKPCTLRPTEIPNGEPCYEIERDVKLTVCANVREGAFLAVTIERYHKDPAVILPLTLDDVAYTLRYPFRPDRDISPGQMFTSSVSFTLVPTYLSMEGCTPEFHKDINFAHVKAVLVDNGKRVRGFHFFTKSIDYPELYDGPIPEECRHLFPSSSSLSLELGKHQQEEREDTSMETPTKYLPQSISNLSINDIDRKSPLLTSH